MLRLALLFSLTAVTGCAAVHRPPTTYADVAAAEAPFAEQQAALRTRVVERLVERVARRGDGTLDILVLSGGGQNGAYGAGFMRGWKTRPDAPMPTFDLVTGISTGSLQSPFAMVGSEPAIDTLSALYLRAADRIAPKLDLFFWLRHTGGVVNTTRYRNTIAAVFDTAMERELRAGFAESRQLLVGTADFDLGRQVVWDAQSVIEGSDSGLARMHEVLLAATAIPSIFPPILLDGHVHADGGVMGNIIPVLDESDYVALGERLRARGMAVPVTVRLWVVYNVWFNAPAVVSDPSDRGKLRRRSESLLFYSGQDRIQQWLVTLPQAVATRSGDVRIEVRATAIPDRLKGDPRAATFFDQSWMADLEKVGYDQARSATPWGPALETD